VNSRARWYAKANALARALQPHQSVALLLAVAEGETRCGDAWPGEHNWGATTRRALHTDELAVLKAAGCRPSVGPDHLEVERQARAILAEAVAEGSLDDPGPGCALHCDSTPTGGPYFVFFAAFPSDVEGAAYFASFFKTAAEKDAITAGDPDALARAMFHAGYYTGFHANDPEANIADYAANLRRILPRIISALVAWTPGADPPAPDVGSVEWVQERLNALGVSTPPLVEDGVLGPKTAAALKAYQISNGLPPTGQITAETVNSLTS
jgi:Putative peptidoglycan binding domain